MRRLSLLASLFCFSGCFSPTDLSLIDLRGLPEHRLSAGTAHTCHVDEGSLLCWGDNSFGQLGLGTISPAEQPTVVSSTYDWESVSAGDASTCAIRRHTLYCWGRNIRGEVGDGTTITRTTPVKIPGEWSQVSVGGRTACAITPNHELYCWGNNLNGQLGTTSTKAFEEAPVRVAGAWRTVGVAEHHACAIGLNGTLWCWGEHPYATFGAGPAHPPRMDPATDWSRVIVATDQTCAIKRSGERYCFEPRGLVLASNQFQWAVLDTENGTSCGISDYGGSLYCWGANDFGQVGDGTTNRRDEPVLIDPQGRWVSVAVGQAHACAVRLDANSRAQRYCWGSRTDRQLADSVDGPQPVIGDGWTAVATGPRYSIGLRSDGALLSWGAQRPDFSYFDPVGPAKEPQPLLRPMRFAAVSVGQVTGFCGITDDHRLFCQDLPRGLNGGYPDGWVEVGDGSQRWLQVAIGKNQTCAIQADASLHCWGSDLVGAPTHPERVDGASWKAVASGERHTCGLRTDGTLWCWGHNAYGQLGVDSAGETWVLTPTQVGEARWDSISAGDYHTCARQADSSLWCWGANVSGQLGLGYTSISERPTRVGTETDWLQVVAGDGRTCGLRSPGQRWCWGRGTDDFRTPLLSRPWSYPCSGRPCVDGDSEERPQRFSASPTRRDSVETWTSLSLSPRLECGTRTDGSIWCEGDNTHGQLGAGSAWYSTPKPL